MDTKNIRRDERHSNRLDGIQLCRGAAALLVVLFHLTGMSERISARPFAVGIFGFGWAGVDLFFVLSGFIIYFVHHQDLGRPNELRSFVEKRVVRIYPIYLLVTLAVLPLYLSGFGESSKRTTSVIVKSLLLWPQTAGVSPIITVGWSLTYEMLFYAFFGVGILLHRKTSAKLFAVWLFISLLTTVASEAGLINAASLPPLAVVFLNQRNLEFGLGCLCGYLLSRKKIHRPGLALAAGVAGFLVTGLNESWRWLPLSVVLTIFLFGLSSFFVVYGAGGLDFARTRRIPSWLLLLGDASYSIYLTHGIFLMAMTTVVQKLHLVRHIGASLCQIGMTAVTLFAGCCIYRYIEKPLLALLRNQLRTLKQASLVTARAV